MSVYNQDPLMEAALEKIESATDVEINDIIFAVRKRCITVFPDWDVICMVLPKGKPEKRKEILQYAFEMIDKENG